MNDDGDNTDCDGVDSDDLECVDGFKNQINRGSLAVAQLTTFCAFCRMTSFVHY